MLVRKPQTVKPFGKGRDPKLPALLLCDRQASMCSAWEEHFQYIDQVAIYRGDILRLKADALVSPANSFGEMSGGLDRAIDLYFEGRAQAILAMEINKLYWGELPVGTALIAEMGTRNFGHLIAAPTMRVPGLLPKDSIHAYLSMRAILVSTLRHNTSSQPAIQSIAIPGLCTGVGGMAPMESALQMLTAYRNIVEGGWRQVVHPAMAPFARRKR
ncbi:macro domain-containing protein [Pontibacter sp. G13]|uniref:macro domain-containing protein n=1 Tax=Pontibacter sp. G13 TaxID=3074898 RepID=UPI00288B2733|nr:macro domain-containing protein [Pontibacter sp. G13]WNJ17021.1 macro domain-containing protein [Pontibacter sp. G13]